MLAEGRFVVRRNNRQDRSQMQDRATWLRTLFRLVIEPRNGLGSGSRSLVRRENRRIGFQGQGRFSNRDKKIFTCAERAMLAVLAWACSGQGTPDYKSKHERRQTENDMQRQVHRAPEQPAIVMQLPGVEGEGAEGGKSAG